MICGAAVLLASAEAVLVGAICGGVHKMAFAEEVSV